MILELGPHPENVSAPVIDWSTTPLAENYPGFYAKVLDGVFTPDECAALINLAESDNKWEQAVVNYGLGKQDYFVDLDYRKSERILRFDRDASEKLYQRLYPYVQELVEIKQGGNWETVVGTPKRITGVWRLAGLNERLSFLRYGKGNYFRSHCDTELELPDGRKSRVTVQIYLGEDDVEGGATRISNLKGDRYIDVMPKKGRVLVFQQRGIWHSGEDVTNGFKYTARTDFMFRQSLRE